MNKFLSCLSFLFIFLSCSENIKKSNPVSKSIDYSNLSSFINDSLPDFKVLDQNYNEVFNLWKDVEIIKKTPDISSSDPRTLIYFLESLSQEVDKINEVQITGILNVPLIIGRLRVYKTDILKINSNKIDLQNFRLFKSNLKEITLSYNALINMMNKVAKDNDKEL